MRSGAPTDRITARPTQNCATSAQIPSRTATTTSIPRLSTHMSRLWQDMWLPDWALQPPSMAPPTAAAFSTFQQCILEVTSSLKSMDCIRRRTGMIEKLLSWVMVTNVPCGCFPGYKLCPVRSC